MLATVFSVVKSGQALTEVEDWRWRGENTKCKFAARSAGCICDVLRPGEGDS